MTTWQRSVPSNQIIQTPHNHALDEDSLSDPPELLEEETLEFQEVVEEAEEEAQEYPQQLHQSDIILGIS